jgi:hypothetical protein
MVNLCKKRFEIKVEQNKMQSTIFETTITLQNGKQFEISFSESGWCFVHTAEEVTIAQRKLKDDSLSSDENFLNIKLSN